MDKVRYGAAGVCRNDKNQFVMVLLGQKTEEKRWSVPSGQIEPGETFQESCAREFWEETGYWAKDATSLLKKGPAAVLRLRSIALRCPFYQVFRPYRILIS
ncbi:NUDIX domain-containing protein [Fictibacillus terranigra]|uniref:NUDIX domain-containing protein n=1 Tax=Fictibacillus terranigra TaxID=3058424 RepID=A0ABT8EE25_9BACL|nr:NUDIX domain-containing protein [Fictibacillus sp. CENA-BCM004]MDN4076122.1 NUDIX domain-containing protein [Fictibacillus sp. CENA-BCM004]